MMHSLLQLAATSAFLLPELVSAQQQREYDYIICGGGTAGLTVANRLSEDEGVNVLIVEAGADVPPGADPGGFPNNWDYPTVPQIYAGGGTRTCPAGRWVGGSTNINGKVYSRPEASQIDTWGKVNKNEWSWVNLFEYYKKSEKLYPPTQQEKEAGETVNEDFHGLKGPTAVSFPARLNGDFFKILEDTSKALGVPHKYDYNGGDAHGYSTYPAQFVVAPRGTTQTRWTARDGYYAPVANRTNLELLQKTKCLSIAWANGKSGGKYVASGVIVADIDGTNDEKIIKAKKEVILSAGVYRSSGILEYSGVGNKNILSKYGIKTRINLPGVGENLQDQMQGQLTYNRSDSSQIKFQTPGNDQITTPDIWHLKVEDVLDKKGVDALRARTAAAIPTLAKKISDRINGALSAAQIQKSLETQSSLVFNSGNPAIELLGAQSQGDDTLTLQWWPLITLSRGNVHISGSNARAAGDAPVIDPNWFMADYDWKIHIAGGRYVRKMFATSPLKNEVTAERRPGYDRVSKNANDDEWKDWIGETFRAGWHAVGATAMLPRSWGGVVDGGLVVYGTENVRVVDNGVVPFELGGHPTATVYALAERAADIIKKKASA